MGKQAYSGFTLIEMIVVLTVLVILAGAVVPMLHRAARQGDLDDVTARVTASARFARETALARAVAVDLTVETAPAAIMLAMEPEGDMQSPLGSSSPMGATMRPNAADQTTLPLPQRYALVLLPDGVTAQLEADPSAANSQTYAAGEALRFPPDGHTQGGVIVLHDARGRERRILVAPGTGQVVGAEQ
jgi:prepilin-type N-terminal cleavage/methylation domain-containing protein